MNVKVMKKFAGYVGITALMMFAISGVTFLAKTYMGHEGYGLIGLLGVFMIWFLYSMAKSDVESAEREEKWANEKLEKKMKITG